MSITRSDLKKQYEQNYTIETNNLINDMFNKICNDIHTTNNYGSTCYQKELFYVQFWTNSLCKKLVTMLKNHYIDSNVYLHECRITVDWSIPNDDITNTVVVGQMDEVPQQQNLKVTSSLSSEENFGKDNNIQINISLPSRVSTRSSARK